MLVRSYSLGELFLSVSAEERTPIGKCSGGRPGVGPFFVLCFSDFHNHVLCSYRTHHAELGCGNGHGRQTWPRQTLLGKLVPRSHWGILLPPHALSTCLTLMTLHARRYTMTLRPHPLPPVPEATVAAVQAAFPRGTPTWRFAPSSTPSTRISSWPIATRPRGVLRRWRPGA